MDTEEEIARRAPARLLCACLVTLAVAGLADCGRIYVLSEDHHRIRKRDTSDSQPTAFSTERLPQKMQLRVEINVTTALELDLEQNTHVTNRVPVTIGVEGRIRPWKSPDRQDFAVYIDHERFAAMFVKSVRGEDYTANYEYLGSFKLGEQHYLVEPANFRQGRSRWKRSRLKRTADYANDYIIRAVTPSELNYTYDAVSRFEKEENYRKEIVQYASQILEDRHVRYGVECLILIDYAIYKNWYDISMGNTDVERRDAAINLIRFYYTHIANGIDLRYMSINEPDFGIYVRLSGFHIATSPESSPWTEGAMVREVDSETGRIYTDAYKGLDELESWLNLYQKDLPFFDQATLFCGNKLFGGYGSDGHRRNIAGLADVNGICTPLRASICQENGQYASTQTAAHEMGHNLGALHDGSQNSCSKYDQYIMAPAPTGLNENNFYNPYKFSRCSIQEIREQIRVMNVRSVNCLINEARHFNETEFKNHLKKMPGQIISLDNQCKNIFGIHSYYCAGMINDEKMCVELVCYDPFQKLCWPGHEQRAASGTTCGNKKWCERGKCVYNGAAPAAKEYCLTGDFQGLLYNGLTCRDVGYNSPRLCYEENYKKACCATCAAIFDKSYPACPYGDKFEWCADSENRRRDNCYDPEFRSICCEYCRNVATGILGCEYGDKATWCSEDVPKNPSLCYGSEQLCCSTCPKYQNTKSMIAGCQYGDKASWCKSYDHGSYCYTGNVADQCCEFCGRARNQYGLRDCPYGDRSINCHRDLCSDSANWYRCCYTCREESGNKERLSTVRPAERTSSSTTPTTTTTTTAKPKGSPTTTTAVMGSPGCVDSASWCVDIESSDCYLVADICCKTCSKAYIGKKDCEYGDHFSWCSGKRDHCGDPSYEDCCITCEGYVYPKRTTSLKTPKPTTEHTTTLSTTTTTTTKTTTISPTIVIDCVDAASWCIISNSYCYNDIDTCCHTCSLAYTGIIGCEYGDHYTWCSEPDINCDQELVKLGCCVACNKTASKGRPTRPTSTTTSPVENNNSECKDIWIGYCANAKMNDCYYDSYQSGCCATCAKYNTGKAGCEYGDQWSWCGTVTELECERDEIAEPCCHTCAKLSGTSDATSTTMTTTTEAWLGRTLMFILNMVVCYLATVT